MASDDDRSNARTAFLAIAGCAFFAVALLGTGAASWMRNIFAGWGLSRTGVNAAYGAVLGLGCSLIIRAALLWQGRKKP